MNRGRVMRRVISLLIGMVLSLSACADKHYKRIIVIDPGHGGIDPGAIGSTSNILEKEVVLRMGLALRDQLEATGRYQVIMTRDEDRIVELCDRLQIVKRSQGELFISLHADSLVSAPEVSGASVYTLSERASHDEHGRLESKENCADILAGIDLSNQDIDPEILIDPAQRDANNKSTALAELLMQELSGATKMVKRRRAQAGFVVLKSPDIPSVLIELGYLSNPADEKALADDAHIARLATAVARAVDVYFGVGILITNARKPQHRVAAGDLLPFGPSPITKAWFIPVQGSETFRRVDPDLAHRRRALERLQLALELGNCAGDLGSGTLRTRIRPTTVAGRRRRRSRRARRPTVAPHR